MLADRARLDAAWTALAALGVTLAELQRDARPALPTFTDCLPQVLVAAGPGALRAYRSYWKRMTTAFRLKSTAASCSPVLLRKRR